jgi:hypothetical protein
MGDMVAINRLFLIWARNESASPAGRLTTGLPQGVLDRIAKLDLAEIDRLAENLSVSVVSLRIDEAMLEKLLAIPDSSRMPFVLSLVAGDTRARRDDGHVAGAKPRIA